VPQEVLEALGVAEPAALVLLELPELQTLVVVEAVMGITLLADIQLAVKAALEL